METDWLPHHELKTLNICSEPSENISQLPTVQVPSGPSPQVENPVGRNELLRRWTIPQPGSARVEGGTLSAKTPWLLSCLYSQ